MKKILSIFAVLFLLTPLVLAAEGDVSAITEPLTKIYDLIKSVASIVGVLAITAGGLYYMFAGNNIQSRENAKMVVSYAVVGLVIVWVAPLLVTYLTPTAPIA